MFMDYKGVSKIGRVKELNKGFGVGKIVAVDDTYLFTINDFKEEINIGDIVKFRAETINKENRAYFVSKIDQNYEIKNNIIKCKTLNNKN